MTKSSFSMLAFEKKLSTLPWIMTCSVWILISVILLFLYFHKPTEENASVTLWITIISFFVLVPGLGGFVSLMMSSRRSRMDTRLLNELKRLLGGDLHAPTLLLPLIRPRLLSDINGIPVEIILSPPIPRTTLQALVDPQRAVAHKIIKRVERTSESLDARLGTADYPQLEIRLGVDLPYKLYISARGSKPLVKSDLVEILVDDAEFTERFRVLSDASHAASKSLSDHDLLMKLAAIVNFNHPWATQLTLRPAQAGHGAGAYALSVAASSTSAETLAETLDQLCDIVRHPAWRSSLL